MNIGSRISALLGGAAAAGLLYGAPAYAQASRQAAQVDELVVTAMRREQSLQETPLSVTSVTATTLENSNIDGSAQLSQIAPGLNLTRAGLALLPTIRGIGTNNSTLGDDPNVSFYIDGVYQQSAAGTSFQLGGIQRVEVLKGPQGTLFGRNSASGAILIITQKPSDTLTGDVSVSYGSRNEWKFNSYVSGPITDRISGSLAALFKRKDGYIDDVFQRVALGETRDAVIRPKIAIALGDKTTLTAAAQYTFSSDPTGVIYSPIGRPSFVALPAGRDLPIASGPHKTALSLTPKNAVVGYQGFVRLETEFSWARFSSQTSAVSVHDHTLLDGDEGPLSLIISDVFSIDKSYQQEFILSSLPSDGLQWVSGLFLYKSDAAYTPRTAGTSANGITPLARIDNYANITSVAIAPFAEATIPLPGNFQLILGGRYNHESKRISGYAVSAAGVRGASSLRSATWRSFTPRAILQYEVPDRLNLYASYSRGFKSGTFNAAAPAAPPVDPEIVDAYELGAKTLGSGMWRLSGAIYYQHYENIQLSAFDANRTQLLFNAATGRSYGGEAAAHGQLTDAFSVDLFATYTKGEYTRFPTAVLNLPAPNGAGNVLLGGVDISGAPFVRSPDWTTGLNFNYGQELAGGQFDATVNVYSRSKIYWELSKNNVAKPYTSINASASWQPGGSHFKYTVYAENLTDADYQVGGNANTAGYYAIWGQPRTMGVKLSASF